MKKFLECKLECDKPREFSRFKWFKEKYSVLRLKFITRSIYSIRMPLPWLDAEKWGPYLPPESKIWEIPSIEREIRESVSEEFDPMGLKRETDHRIMDEEIIGKSENMIIKRDEFSLSQ